MKLPTCPKCKAPEGYRCVDLRILRKGWNDRLAGLPPAFYGTIHPHKERVQAA